MGSASLRRLNQIILLALLMMAGLAACNQKTQPPKLLTSYTFPQLSENKPIGMQVAETNEPSLLIRVEGYETAFESSLSSADGSHLSVARLPYLRVGPVFHVIELLPGEGPLSISIIPDYVTRNSFITVRVYTLPNATKLDARRISAFKYYGQAVQSTNDESPELWTQRAEYLRSAASGFEQSGDTELQLWSEYLAAYFHYFPLGELKTAIELARQTQAQARKFDQPLIELMALQLEGQVLIERDRNDSAEQAEEKFQQAQKALQLAIAKAAELGMAYEQAWAINTRGIGYFNQDRYTEAEQQYRQALAISLELEDRYLVQSIKGNLALVRERLGDLDGALAMLTETNQQLQSSGTDADLAHNWSEIGRLYQKLFLFPQAVDALSRSLDLAREINSAEVIARTGSSLAHAYFGMGYMERAASTMEGAIADMEAANYARGLREGYRLLADIHRFQGDFAQMSVARQLQEKYLTATVAKAHFQYSLGLDALARYPEDLTRAGDYFAAAQQLVANGQDEDLRFRAWFYSCLVDSSAGQAFPPCAATSLQTALAEWLPMATPAREFEIRFLLARILILQGAEPEAINLLADLIDDIQRFRSDLPGVLGAWYWENRAPIFQAYLELSLQQANSKERGIEALLALNRIRNTSLVVERSSPPGRESFASDSARQELRSLLARLELDQPAKSRLEIRQALDRKLLEWGSEGRAPIPRLERGQLEQALAVLPVDSALLSYYFSDQAAWAWLADQRGVQLLRLAGGTDPIELLNTAREGLRTIGNDRLDQDLQALGDALLAPLTKILPKRIYLLVAGDLAGFPFEAIRHNGRYFGQDHQVINLMTLQGLAGLQQMSNASSWSKIFLAGVATDQPEISQLPGAEKELNDIRNIFQDIEIKEYSNVYPEFGLTDNQAYIEADLVHFASHGQINLEYPELSRLVLSGQAGTNTGNYLAPIDIRRSSINAELVVLSACETTGVNSFTFDSNLGFISEFLQSGASAVVASLWPVGDTYTQAFMQDFYSALVRGMSAPEALSATKRRHLADKNTGNALAWASFQIYIK